MTSKPFIHASDATLAAAVEENLFAFFRTMATMPGSEIVEGDRLSYHLTFPDAPMYKGIWNSRFSADEADSAIEQGVELFQAKGAPFVTWWFNNHPQPANLLERLEVHGFEHDYSAPGMAIELDSLGETLPDELSIVSTHDDQTYRDWIIVLCGSYGMSFARAQAWTEATQALGGEDAPWRLYVGYWQGQPVACNLLFNGAGVAGLYCVGTIPDARGKGFGKAITLKPLLDARAAGYHYGVLFASDEGLPMYQRLGFWLVDIIIGRYIWHNEG